MSNTGDKIRYNIKDYLSEKEVKDCLTCLTRSNWIYQMTVFQQEQIGWRLWKI